MRKSELESLFNDLSYTLNPVTRGNVLKATGRGGQSAARDYVSACCLLAEVRKVLGESADLSGYTEDALWKVLHPAVRFRLRSYTPCLAARYDELKEAQQKQFFEDRDWVFTSKENGVRGWLICTPDGQVHLFSRNYSDVDCSLLEYWPSILQTVRPHNDVLALDVEIMFAPGADISADLERLGLETDSQLDAMVALLHMNTESALEIQRRFKETYGRDLIEFRLIHPLYLDGVNYLTRTIGEGLDKCGEAVIRAQVLGLNVKMIKVCDGTRTEKENFLNSILNNGGEGVVGHYRKGSYCVSENRSKEAFVKLKRSVTATMSGSGMGDSIDGFVSGFKMGTVGTANEGLVGALEFSIFVEESDGSVHNHVIAYVPGLDQTTRQSLTVSDASGLYPQEWIGSDGEVHVTSMNPEFDRLVGTLDGQALSAVSQRLEHPRLTTWRVERSPESCVYTRAFLDSQTTASHRVKGAGITYAQNAEF